ncbi:acyltransferase [Actinotalea sp. M2MS4P-6]|uniref:acyltransferase family protein n=1 Tax=Actinotalea sp. M2MS4P-6 TaxID=2983762 RepID=UPI0021E44B73|nr:acyltransferase [Actinotalea sp. M2MS4P-6]MCV2396357.1 acyltransferase [Actinotalea sp. M2MS4P-6]
MVAEETVTQRPATLATLVDPRANALNSVRLMLAASVLVWHAYRLNGHPWPNAWTESFAGMFGVDGFFAISGFLLAGSWLHNPKLVSYFRNRILRIMPAFWMCLVVVAFGFAPFAMLLDGRPVSDVLVGEHSAVHYVLVNLPLQMQFWDVAGTPAGVPYDGVWNGSLWTLKWEALAYVGLAALGVAGLVRRRMVPLALLVLTWFVIVGQTYGVVPANYWLDNGARLGFMFLAGMVLQLYGDRISASPVLVGVAVVLFAVSPVLPNYEIIAGLPLAYLVIWVGGRLKDPRLRLTDRDISYGLYIYAFPVQQSLVLLGSPGWNPWLAALVALALAVPLAVLSWVLVERPALRLKKRRPRPAPDAAPS